MKTIVHLIVVLICLHSSCSNNEKESWELEELAEDEKELVNIIRQANDELARNFEIILKKKTHEGKKKDAQLELKDPQLEQKDGLVKKYREQMTCVRLTCAISRIKGCTAVIWDKDDKINGVYSTTVVNNSKTYYDRYKVKKRTSKCKVYEFLKFEEDYEFPKERKNLESAFIWPFAKYYCYLMYNKTRLSRKIVSALQNSGFYDNETYEGCEREDFIFDFIFSLNKQHLLVNLFIHELFNVLSTPENSEKNLVELLNREMQSRYLPKWYYPKKYLFHINVVCKCLYLQPLYYVDLGDGNIIPQSDDCPRYEFNTSKEVELSTIKIVFNSQ